MNALRKSFLYSNFKEYAILAKAFDFWLAFLQRDLTWGSNFSLWLKWIPRSFLHLLLEMAISPILILSSRVEFLRRCGFSGFAFRRLSVNHLNKVFEIFMDRVVRYSNLCWMRGEFCHLRSLQYLHRGKIGISRTEIRWMTMVQVWSLAEHQREFQTTNCTCH